MKRKLILLAAILVPVLCLKAQNRDYVFDAQKLLPETSAAIDSTAEYLYDKGLTSKSNIGLFKESVQYVGTVVRGSDQALLDYCRAVTLMADENDLITLERAMKNNLSFLRDKVLYSGLNGVSWRIYDDSTRMTQGRYPLYELLRGKVSCAYGRDTISITGFSGVYDPFSDTFSADEGSVSWELSPGDSISVMAHNFAIDIRSGTFTAENTRAAIPKFRIKGLSGKLEFAPQAGVYPAFFSREGGIPLQDKDATYSASGRVVIRGNSSVSVEKDENSHARLLLFKEGKTTAVVKSSEIAVTDSILRIPKAMAVIYVKNDSVVHPLMLARYETVPRTLTLYQLPDKLSAAPFYDSFSAIKMFAKAVRLDNSTGDISFVFDASVRPAVISDKYFEPQIYKYFQGTAMRNPLPLLQGIYDAAGTPYVGIDAIARGMGISTNDAVHMAMDIAYLGYGNYDYEKRALMLYPGFAHMVSSARGHSDFDGISYYGRGERDIVSRMDGQTGHIDLSGMEMVKLSPKGDIFLRPDSSGVRLGQKGNFSYGGSITLGLFTVSGTDAQFLYEQNKIELKGTSSMSFEVPSFSNPREKTTVRNTIDSLRGSIEINAPDNKSAKAKNGGYPRITTISQGYIFYDSLDSLYSRDELFVSIEPFTLDSLASRRTEGIKFDGRVHTGIIVPAFDRTVSVQDDYTLGFSDADFSSGVQFYGRGTFYGIMSLGHGGLAGKGRFTWFGAQVVSDTITMLPRTALAGKADFTINAGGGENALAPEVSAPGARVEWAAASDSLAVYADSLASQMYGGAIKFGGKLVLTPQGLTGLGRAASDLAVMDSRAFSFGRSAIQSEEMDIRFGTEEKPEKISLEKVGAYIDVEGRTGRFTLSPLAGKVSLPEDSANVYLKETVWDMDGRSIGFSAGEGRAGRITAKAGSADSLSFLAASAVYSISSDSLDIAGVERLTVGDALVVPHDGSLKILPGGAIEPFDGAEIFLDTASRRHRLYDASVEIISGHRMMASATYDYTDPDGVQYPMLFNDISVDAVGETVAAADTYMDKDYELGAYFLFRGQSTLKGSSPGLGLRGTVRPAISACNKVETGEMEIDIPLDSTGRMLLTPSKSGYVNGITYGADGFRGAFLKSDSISVRNAFANAGGNVWYDDYAGAYIATPDTSKGAYEAFRYFNDECRINVKGEIFIRDPQGAVTMRAFGQSDIDLNTGRIEVSDMTLCMELSLPKEVSVMLSSLAGAMQAGAKTKPSLSAEYAYEKLLGITDSDDIAFTTGVPQAAAFTLMLSACDFSWDEQGRRLFTSSPSFNIEQAGGTPLQQSVNGYVEIIKNFRSGDEVSVLIEGEGDFFFIRYKSGTTEFLCSSADVMSVFDKATEKYKNPAPGEYAVRRATKARLAAFRENMPVRGK